MPFTLQICSGSLAGKQIALEEGQSLRFGRGPQSDVLLPNDPKVSALHFELTLENAVCRLRDLHSTNGTYVNNQRVETAILVEGHKVRAGVTELLVLSFQRASPLNPATSPKLIFQGWAFPGAPSGWEILDGRGFRRMEKERFPANVVATAEILAEGTSLKQYVDSQLVVLTRYLPNATSNVSTGRLLPGCDEAINLVLRYAADDGRLVAQRQLYVRRRESVGILTLTALEEEFPSLQPIFDSLAITGSFLGF